MKTFSNRLTVVILGFYAFVYIGVAICDSIFKINLRYLLDYIQPIVMAVVLANYGKNTVENSVRFGTNYFNKQNQSNNTTINNNQTPQI